MDYKKQIFVTKQGFEELKKELEDLEKVKRPQVLERVSAARAMGDLSENSEYTAAREELNLIDGRIEELGDIIKKAKARKAEKTQRHSLNTYCTRKVLLRKNQNPANSASYPKIITEAIVKYTIRLITS